MSEPLKTTDKRSENGNLYFNDKDIQYLKKQSREVVEEIHNMSVLYFALDWEQSKKNFYGELTMKKFKQPRGIEVRGKFKITQGGEQLQSGVPNKIMKMVVSVYREHLHELNIDPQRGDYFGIGKRLYQIYDYTIEDVGPGNVLLKRENLRVDYFAIMDDDEVIQKDVWGDNLGLEEQIRP